MEEDVEIELLLKSNEQLLEDAAEFSEGTIDFEDEETTNIINNSEVQLGSAKALMKNKGSDYKEGMNNMSNNNVSGQDIESVVKDHLKNIQNREYLNFDQEAIGGVLEDRAGYLEKRENRLLQVEVNTNKSRQELNNSDELQEMLNDHMVTLMAENPSKHLTLQSIDSDEESTISDNSFECNSENDFFINEIIADDEPKYTGRFMDQIRNQVCNKSKSQFSNKTIKELTAVQKLFLERDNLLTNLESKLQQELHENEEKQKQIRDNILLLSEPDNSKLKEPSFTRCFFKKFGIPYFEDANGFIPPPNNDHRRKLERGELIVTAIPKIRHWIKPHKELLKGAIKKTIYNEKSEKLVYEIKKLKELLGSSETENSNLLKEINEKQDKLSCLKNKSYLQLVGAEDPEREYDWMKYSVSVFNGTHTPEECQRFWHVYLKPSINKDSWEINEDLKLLEIAEEMQCQDWDAIAELLGSHRTAYQCFVHYQTRIHSKNNYTSGKWTKEEDERLIKVINASRIGNFIPWTKVSSYMGNRTHFQIYNRWSKCLNPQLVKGKFSKQEDLLIVSGIEVFGASFKELSSLMNNRSCSQLRERYERHLLPKTAKVGSWSLEEDEQLLNLIQKYGEHNWVAIASEIKTRTRTQVRQRYNFIKHLIKTKPGWTVAQVKRRNNNNVSEDKKQTQKHVEKMKKEIDEVESVFNLSRIERETFRIEKLKELRDKIMIKQFDLKRKKKLFSDSSDLNNVLLEFFKNSCSNPPATFTDVRNAYDYDSYLNHILLMTKYFGHGLQLPKIESDICNNPRLNFSLKCFIQESLNNRIFPSVKILANEEPSCSTLLFNSENNIDYIMPDHDDTIMMKDWWHTPPVDVSNLNFSEFFKRTVFDYSYGMHQDIWLSKVKRSLLSNGNENSLIYEPGESGTLDQHYNIPPNYITTLGFKSVLLSRTRLKREASGKFFLINGNESNEENFVIKNDSDKVITKLLNQFQNTMGTLFTWPKVLSLTSITLAPIPLLSSVSNTGLRNKKKGKNNIVKMLSNSGDHFQNEIKTVETLKIKALLEKEKRKNYNYEQKLRFKRHLGELRKGIRCKRKMKIEHLLKNIDEKESSISNMGRSIKMGRPRKSRVKKPLNGGITKPTLWQLRGCNATKSDITHKKEINKLNKSSGNKFENFHLSEFCSMSLQSSKVTYSRKPKEPKKRQVSHFNELCEPVRKKIKCEKNRLGNSDLVESCLEIPHE